MTSSGSDMLFAIIRQVQIDQIQTDQADGDVDEEDHPPVKVADDQAAGDGSEHGADQTGDGDEAHRADEFGFGEGPHEREAADRAPSWRRRSLAGCGRPPAHGCC